MAKGQKNTEKGPKKADDAARQLKKASGPKYLRGTMTTPGGLLPNKPGRAG